MDDIKSLVERLRRQGASNRLAAPIEAADLIEQQADRIAALETKCRLYEAALDEADGEIEDLKCELREAIEDGFSQSTGEKT